MIEEDKLDPEEDARYLYTRMLERTDTSSLFLLLPQLKRIEGNHFLEVIDRLIHKYPEISRGEGDPDRLRAYQKTLMLKGGSHQLRQQPEFICRPFQCLEDLWQLSQAEINKKGERIKQKDKQHKAKTGIKQ